MSQNTSFKVVLQKLSEEYTDAKQEIAFVIASLFSVEKQKALDVLNKLPVIVLDNLSAQQLRNIKNDLFFLHKLGVEYDITSKKCNYPNVNWNVKGKTNVVYCPCCGEGFALIHPSDIQNVLPKTGKSKTDDVGAISAEFEEVEGLSAELESIVDMEDDIQSDAEIEEIGSVSQDMEEVGSFSEELEKIGELPDFDDLDVEKTPPKKETNDPDEYSEIEDIGAEFEEIEGVSAEFERISLEEIGEDIGSLSAELEEIEGISAEFERISEDDLEKIDEISSISSNLHFNKQGSNSDELSENGLEKIDQTSSNLHFNKQENNLDELEGISAELEKVADPIDEGLLDQMDMGADKKPKAKKRKTLRLNSGPCSVLVNFNSGNLSSGLKFFAQLKKISVEEAGRLAKGKTSVVVAQNISKEAASEVAKRFQKYKMQTTIKTRK